MPITNKKPPSIEGELALVFYCQKLSLILKDLDVLNSNLWQDCTNKQDYRDDLGLHHNATCNRRGDESPCSSCIDNVAVAKEKRRLKAQFNKVVSKMLMFTPLTPELCHKTEESFVDIQYKKLVKD